jgi:3-hydroxybutyryl-CoA dehydratase
MTGSGVGDLPVGRKFTVRKTVTEADVLRFADLTGDFDRLHVDADYCRTTRYGKQIAHGALIIGYMSAASSKATEDFGRPVASLGFDRIRHVMPVFVGDTVTVTYEIVATDPARERATARIAAVNQHGEVVAVADHVLKLV